VSFRFDCLFTPPPLGNFHQPMNIRVFLLLPILPVSPYEEPAKLANYTAISQIATISHTYHQIHNIVYDKQKQNKFYNYIVHDTSKTKTAASESKEQLWCHVVAARSSHWVEEVINESPSYPPRGTPTGNRSPTLC
jgi:hypothetical protein